MALTPQCSGVLKQASFLKNSIDRNIFTLGRLLDKSLTKMGQSTNSQGAAIYVNSDVVITRFNNCRTNILEMRLLQMGELYCQPPIKSDIQIGSMWLVVRLCTSRASFPEYNQFN